MGQMFYRILMGTLVSFSRSYQSWNMAANLPFFSEMGLPLKLSTGTILSPPITIISVALVTASSMVMSLKDIFSMVP